MPCLSYTVHLTLYTLHCTPYTVHPTPYTLHREQEYFLHFRFISFYRAQRLYLDLFTTSRARLRTLSTYARILTLFLKQFSQKFA